MAKGDILISAIRSQNVEAAQEALIGTNIDFQDKDGLTPLMHAILTDNMEMFQTVLQAGPSLGVTDSVGNTALLVAAEAGNLRMVKDLISNGADVNAVNSGETSSLFFAAVVGQYGMVKALVESGADPSRRNLSGLSAQDIASSKGFEDISKYLEEVEAEHQKLRRVRTLSKTETRVSSKARTSLPSLHPSLAQSVVRKKLIEGIPEHDSSMPHSSALLSPWGGASLTSPPGVDSPRRDSAVASSPMGQPTSWPAVRPDSKPLQRFVTNSSLSAGSAATRRNTALSLAGPGASGLRQEGDGPTLSATGNLAIPRTLTVGNLALPRTKTSVNVIREDGPSVPSLPNVPRAPSASTLQLPPSASDLPLAQADAIRSRSMSQDSHSLAANNILPEDLSHNGSKSLRSVALAVSATTGMTAALRRNSKDGTSDLVSSNPLVSAAASGLVDIVSQFLRTGESPDAKDSNGNTALIVAAMFGRIDVVRLLLGGKTKPNVNIANMAGSTALFEAVKGGFKDIVKLLVTVPGIVVDLFLPPRDCSPFMFAVERNLSSDVIELLLNNGASIVCGDIDGRHCMDRAILRGNLSTVDRLLSLGFPLDVGSAGEHSPLNLAVKLGHVPIVSTLLKAGAPMTSNENGDTALMVAASLGRSDILSVMVNAGGVKVDHHGDNGGTPLIVAVAHNHKACVEMLLRNNASVNFPAVDGTTALMAAAELDGGSSSSMVALLLQHGADASLRDHVGNTATQHASVSGNSDLARMLEAAEACTLGAGPFSLVFLACMCGNISIVKEYFESGFVAAVDQQQRTGLMIAASNNHSDIVHLLLTHPDVNIFAMDMSNECALYKALKHSHLAVAKLLIDRLSSAHAAAAMLGEMVNTHSAEHGLTLLHLACKQAPQFVPRLLSFGADANSLTQNSRREAALHLAAVSGDLDALQALVEVPDFQMEVTDMIGRTAIMRANGAGKHAMDVILFLLHNGANPTAVDSRGCTLLHHLLRRSPKSHRMLTFLLQTVNDICRSDPGLLKELKSFLLNWRNDDGETPASLVLEHGSDEMILTLLQEPSLNPQVPGRDDVSLLGLAIARKKLSIAVDLIVLGCPVDSRDVGGDTVLIKAVRDGDCEVLPLLHAAGADVHVCDSRGYNLVDIAIASLRFETLPFLVEMGLTLCMEDLQTIVVGVVSDA